MPELGIFILQTKGNEAYEINSFKNLSNGLIEAKVNYLLDYETETDVYEEKKEILKVLVNVNENINEKLVENKITFQKIDQNIRDLTYNLTSIISFENKFKQMILHEREHIKRAKLLVKELKRIGLVK
jgi:Lon protease-like protein